ncbi:hypothetical protein H1S01_00810 [Heliobacterium chlorum]|uniref:Uncharacterized protein n=1 Tax=Heliobacterium chlorum TaxID=2698 RepID=A0ABR7SWW3_HELCL|nr:hypothetical protein [Heliobacterium chlorum]MBC9783044.1 hypothetical protein [Heliobacterium chlorum]
MKKEIVALDRLIDDYMATLPPGMREKELARIFNRLQAFCAWFYGTYGYYPYIDDFSGDIYRTARTAFIKNRPEGPLRAIQCHFQTIVDVDMFAEWLHLRPYVSICHG